jgi:CBS-domain-containing membrane protein
LTPVPATAAEIMDRDVPGLAPQDEARRAIELLAEREIGALPVVNSEQRVIGIVSESDLVLSEEQADLHLPHFLNIMGGIVFVESMRGFEDRLHKAFATKVRDLMTPDPVCAHTDDGVEKVARLIAEKHHNHLPVVDGDGRLAGVVTRADVLAALVSGE